MLETDVVAKRVPRDARVAAIPLEQAGAQELEVGKVRGGRDELILPRKLRLAGRTSSSVSCSERVVGGAVESLLAERCRNLGEVIGERRGRCTWHAGQATEDQVLVHRDHPDARLVVRSGQLQVEQEMEVVAGFDDHRPNVATAPRPARSRGGICGAARLMRVGSDASACADLRELAPVSSDFARTRLFRRHFSANPCGARHRERRVGSILVPPLWGSWLTRNRPQERSESTMTRHTPRPARLGIAALATVALAAGALIGSASAAAAAPPPTPVTRAALDPALVAGRGATVAFARAGGGERRHQRHGHRPRPHRVHAARRRPPAARRSS